MPEPRILLLAAGGHASVALDALLSAGAEVQGILDPGRSAGDSLFGVPVLGGEDYLHDVDRGSVRLVNGLGLVSSTARRAQLFEQWVARGFRFREVIHPATVIGRQCDIGEGAQVFAGAVLQCNVALAANTVVNTGAQLDHDCRVGRHAFIGPGAVLCGAVQLGSGVFVGAGAVLLPGVSVGDGAVVAAGAIVRHDVPAAALVAGNPASAKHKGM
jgi:sugar O-acyltransferase (sialic acid O-acetyltransferase NeuD family)